MYGQSANNECLTQRPEADLRIVRITQCSELPEFYRITLVRRKNLRPFLRRVPVLKPDLMVDVKGHRTIF